ncbi:hypothetical protein H7K45_06100 [Mycobacterium yunnanensis]|uniref:Uncharacterized protein n=1 Tax=Mycobacterium yunnanensis TaxID=368477 RepID=A0A9X2YYV4_9MYCO|nr:hypothetical protein [Mycobacterium yunnanensis]MCV7420105.1 hypothetical protein [Mycobacterium yunnanensis]
MTPRSRIPQHCTDDSAPELVAATHSALPQRFWARVFATRYDLRTDQGVPVTAGSPLAAHHQRLLSRRERTDLAAALTLLLEDADRPTGRGDHAPRVPIEADAVRRSVDVVDDVRARLLGPLPVRARGMARLRILLGDGRGPTYRAGRGTFASAIRGVLAAL